MPSKVFADFEKQLRLLVRDTSELFKDNPYADAINQAVFEYSHDEPLRIVQSYTAGENGALMPGSSPGSPDRTFPLPTYWDDDISIRSFKIEHPIDNTRLRDRVLDAEECEYYLTPTGPVLRVRAEQWIDIVPEQGDVFYLRYCGLHRLTNVSSTQNPKGENTISDSRFYAVCDLAASILCKLAASRTAGLGSANIDGGQASYQTQSAQWLKMRDFYYGEYCKVVKPKVDDSKPSGVFITPKTSELHEYSEGLWPRDNDGRKNLIN